MSDLEDTIRIHKLAAHWSERYAGVSHFLASSSSSSSHHHGSDATLFSKNTTEAQKTKNNTTATKFTSAIDDAMWQSLRHSAEGIRHCCCSSASHQQTGRLALGRVADGGAKIDVISSSSGAAAAAAASASPSTEGGSTDTSTTTTSSPVLFEMTHRLLSGDVASLSPLNSHKKNDGKEKRSNFEKLENCHFHDGDVVIGELIHPSSSASEHHQQKKQSSSEDAAETAQQPDSNNNNNSNGALFCVHGVVSLSSHFQISENELSGNNNSNNNFEQADSTLRNFASLVPGVPLVTALTLKESGCWSRVRMSHADSVFFDNSCSSAASKNEPDNTHHHHHHQKTSNTPIIFSFLEHLTNISGSTSTTGGGGSGLTASATAATTMATVGSAQHQDQQAAHVSHFLLQSRRKMISTTESINNNSIRNVKNRIRRLLSLCAGVFADPLTDSVSERAGCAITWWRHKLLFASSPLFVTAVVGAFMFLSTKQQAEEEQQRQQRKRNQQRQQPGNNIIDNNTNNEEGEDDDDDDDRHFFTTTLLDLVSNIGKHVERVCLLYLDAGADATALSHLIPICQEACQSLCCIAVALKAWSDYAVSTNNSNTTSNNNSSSSHSYSYTAVMGNHPVIELPEHIEQGPASVERKWIKDAVSDLYILSTDVRARLCVVDAIWGGTCHLVKVVTRVDQMRKNISSSLLGMNSSSNSAFETSAAGGGGGGGDPAASSFSTSTIAALLPSISGGNDSSGSSTFSGGTSSKSAFAMFNRAKTAVIDKLNIVSLSEHDEVQRVFSFLMRQLKQMQQQSTAGSSSSSSSAAPGSCEIDFTEVLSTVPSSSSCSKSGKKTKQQQSYSSSASSSTTAAATTTQTTTIAASSSSSSHNAAHEAIARSEDISSVNNIFCRLVVGHLLEVVSTIIFDRNLLGVGASIQLHHQQPRQQREEGRSNNSKKGAQGEMPRNFFLDSVDPAPLESDQQFLQTDTDAQRNHASRVLDSFFGAALGCDSLQKRFGVMLEPTVVGHWCEKGVSAAVRSRTSSKFATFGHVSDELDSRLVFHGLVPEWLASSSSSSSSSCNSSSTSSSAPLGLLLVRAAGQNLWVIWFTVSALIPLRDQKEKKKSSSSTESPSLIPAALTVNLLHHDASLVSALLSAAQMSRESLLFDEIDRCKDNESNNNSIDPDQDGAGSCCFFFRPEAVSDPAVMWSMAVQSQVAFHSSAAYEFTDDNIAVVEVTVL